MRYSGGSINNQQWYDRALVSGVEAIERRIAVLAIGVSLAPNYDRAARIHFPEKRAQDQRKTWEPKLIRAAAG